MTWVKIDDGFPSHPKVLGLSDGAFRVYVSAICYAARYETNGRISGVVVRQHGWQRRVRELVEARLFDPIEDGFVIHDYLEYNPSKDQVTAAREASKRRQERFRKRDSNAVTNALQAGDRNADPVPTRPDPLPSLSVPPTPHRTGLTDEQELLRVKLHGEARDKLLGGKTAPDIDWCEDLIRRGLTESDIDVGVQASLGKGLNYARAVMLRRVEEREAGVDHDQLARDRAADAARESHAGQSRPRGVAGNRGGRVSEDYSEFGDVPEHAIRATDLGGDAAEGAGARAPISLADRTRAGGGAG